MGAELVNPAPREIKTFTEICDELCPYYMSLGMSYNDFWNGSPDMIRQFRRKYEYERDRQNQWAWLQGYYSYIALCRASPLLKAFVPENVEAVPYIEDPIPLTQKQLEEWEEKQQRREFERIRMYMHSRQCFNNKQGGD